MGQIKQNSMIIKDACILFLITVIAGTLLGLVNQVTLQPIADANAKAKEQAYKVVYENATSFQENSQINQLLEKQSYEGAQINEVLEAVNQKQEVIGYVLNMTAKEGYGGDVVFTIGVTKAGDMTGFSVLSHNETAGLGANCTSAEFAAQFVGLQGPEIAYTKDGAKDKSTFDALSGATITSKALTKGINVGLAFLHENNYTTEGGQ